MRAILSASIPVSRVAVFAEMAWLKHRPELGLLCRAARAHGDRITVAMVQSGLPGLSDAGARNVVSWCATLGLCDAGGALTALGEDVAETDEAPVPEQGVYGMWLAQHPLLGRRVLAIERLTSYRDARFDDIVPFAVEPDRGRTFRSVLDADERFVVRDLPANHGQPGAIVGTTQATCRLRWTLDFDQARDQWQLDGLIETPIGNGKHTLGPMAHEPESDGLDLWNLAATWATGPLAPFGRWKAKERRLAVGFDGLTGPEIDAFRKTLALRQVEIPGKGAYDNVYLEDVPIGPESAADADRWAMARFDQLLATKTAYRSRGSVRTSFADLTEETPLEPFSPMLPAHDALLDRFIQDPERFWALAAPVDLAPFPPSSDDLGPLRVGVPPATPIPADGPGVVRIPYRGGWSMRQLVDRLLAARAPHRVLLCDRYVRGDENLATLTILVASLRAVAPNVGIDVWTGTEEADFKRVQALTGSTPRGYGDAFGRNLPHDRYFLVRTAEGGGFGWHMSNSPLHARADVSSPGPETPLRWKDLMATEVTADGLEPALRQWLAGGAR